MIMEWTNFHYLGHSILHPFPPLTSTLLIIFSPLGLQVGTKVLFFLIFFLSSIFAYYYVYQLTNSRIGSFLAGLAYMFIPYHLIETVFEGHWGLGLAYTLLPLLFLTVDRALQITTARKIILAGIVTALVVLTHPQVFPLLVGPFLGIYALWHILQASQRNWEGKTTSLASVLIFSIGLMLSAFWWFPLLWEADLFHATSFTLEEASGYSATFLQAISLRPGSCCNPTGAFSTADSVVVQLLRLFPVVLVLLGIVTNRNNRYVWLFATFSFVSILLSMGTKSPIDIYSIGYHHIPFFSEMRTPPRFLLITSLAYAVLIGFASKSIIQRFQHTKWVIVVAIVMSLLILGNTWTESRHAFETFELTEDQQQAFEWLDQQTDGRVMAAPLTPWIYTSEYRNITHPVNYTQFHGKELIGGGSPGQASRWIGDLQINMEFAAIEQQTNIEGILDLLGVSYIIFDKTHPLAKNYIMDTSVGTPAFESETIDVYRHSNPHPRIFATVSSKTTTPLITDWQWREGSQEPSHINKNTEYSRSDDYSWQVSYLFDNSYRDWMFIGTNLDTYGEEFNSIAFWYFLPQSISDMNMTIRLLEADGSTYSYALAMEKESGWHHIKVPLALFQLRWSQDDNMHLDPRQITQLWLGVGEGIETDKEHEFSVYFTDVQLTVEAIQPLNFTQIHPGKYEVQLDSAKSSHIILTESYFPGWVATINGNKIPSERTYGFLNGWEIDNAQEHSLTLEFIPTNQRKAGSAMSILALIGISIYPLVVWARIKRVYRRKR
ncbi:MAG: 6-pyruvoyl-tetrahydropterin synthase-related protein [Chloroflexota bacterium]|nr:6-pyruvoyl-tetrahydropterin synthase-related protein [Chloroflexota bacterium]